MIKAYYTGANGAASNKSYLDVISNNMANIQTAGFKRSKVGKVDVIFSQGAPFRTGVSTDFAITGDGFFAIQFEEENLFTRGGNFQIANIDDENYLMYQGGYVLNNEEEPIILEDADHINNVDIGVFIFDNNNDLQQAGNNLYKMSNEDGEYNITETNETKILQGYLEASNVEVSEEMVKLIQIQRSFQLNSNLIQTADEIEQVINSLRG